MHHKWKELFILYENKPIENHTGPTLVERVQLNQRITLISDPFYTLTTTKMQDVGEVKKHTFTEFGTRPL